MKPFATSLTIALAACTALVMLLPHCADAAPSGLTPLGGRPTFWIGPSRHGTSWMARTAMHNTLLYVSDALSNDVNVYSYPQDQLVGILTGFNSPDGLCVDAKNDVFIANYRAATILEYAHGGTAPIATLNDPSGFPEGCSIDYTTGNLAVTNYVVGSGKSNVLVYPAASGTPTEYTDSNVWQFRYCGYDNQGNLFVDGLSGTTFALDELASGSSTLAPISLNQSMGNPGAVQWDGRFLAIGSGNNSLYRFSISNSKGYVVGQVPLNGAQEVEQFRVQGNRLIAPDFGAGTVWIYPYPAGGGPLRSITGLKRPSGAVVSKG